MTIQGGVLRYIVKIFLQLLPACLFQPYPDLKNQYPGASMANPVKDS
jgi:hypothetical protein